MIDWKRKLTSRKFWVAICALATNIIYFLNGTEETAVRITALIMSGAAVIAYIIGEGLVDAANAGIIEIPFDDEEGEEDVGE